MIKVVHVPVRTYTWNAYAYNLSNFVSYKCIQSIAIKFACRWKELHVCAPIFLQWGTEFFQLHVQWNLSITDLQIKDTSLFHIVDTSSGPYCSYCELKNVVKATPSKSIASARSTWRWLIHQTKRPNIEISLYQASLVPSFVVWVISVMHVSLTDWGVWLAQPPN